MGIHAPMHLLKNHTLSYIRLAPVNTPDATFVLLLILLFIQFTTPFQFLTSDINSMKEITKKEKIKNKNQRAEL